MRNIIKILFLVGISLSVSAGEQGCLKDRWEEVSSNDKDKEFDLKHDLDKDGGNYSCNSYLSAAEINMFLSELKDAIKANDVKSVAEMVRYPLNVALDETFIDNEGHQKHSSFDVKDKQEFIDNYNKIMTASVRKIVDCSTLKNMFAMPSQGVLMANGEFIFGRNFNLEKRTIHIFSVIAGKRSHEKWLHANCSS